MDATVEQVGAVALVRVTGSVDGLTADSLQTTFREQLDAGVSRVVADLSGVEYTSSAGLRTLLATMKLARQKGGDLRPRGGAAGRAPGARSERVHHDPQALSRRGGGGRELRVTAGGSPKRRVALVIGAGSVKCAAALGLWRALLRHDIELTMVVGCSGGSLYAAVMALGYDLETCERLTRELWTREVTRERNTRGILAAIFPRLFQFDGKFGMVHDRAMGKALAGPYGAHICGRDDPAAYRRDRSGERPARGAQRGQRLRRGARQHRHPLRVAPLAGEWPPG